jgi:hypothetical protein
MTHAEVDMPRLRIEIDQQTYDKLAESAVRELRPVVWHAEALIRRALGLPFPVPDHQDDPAPVAQADAR